MEDLNKKINKQKSPGESYFDRAMYYKKLGATEDDKNIPEIKSYLKEEQDPWAKSYALAALVKLGDKESLKEFLLSFNKVQVDEVEDFVELIQYIGQKKVAIGFLPWLDNEKAVRPISNRQNGPSIRWCDYAVWNSHLLGLDVNPKPTHLTNFNKATRVELNSKLNNLK